MRNDYEKRITGSKISAERDSFYGLKATQFGNLLFVDIKTYPQKIKFVDKFKCLHIKRSRKSLSIKVFLMNHNIIKNKYIVYNLWIIKLRHIIIW